MHECSIAASIPSFLSRSALPKSEPKVPTALGLCLSLSLCPSLSQVGPFHGCFGFGTGISMQGGSQQNNNNTSEDLGTASSFPTAQPPNPKP